MAILGRLLWYVCSVSIVLMITTSCTAAIDLDSIVTPNYLRMGNCSVVTADVCPDLNELRKNCPVEPVRDSCGVCRTCPKELGEKCGGPFNMYGICHSTSRKKLNCNNNGTKVSLQYVMNGIDVSGICLPPVCNKDCSTRPTTLDKWICGSDGIWRHNNCFFNKVNNCNLETDLRISKVDDESICGPKIIPTTPEPEAAETNE